MALLLDILNVPQFKGSDTDRQKAAMPQGAPPTLPASPPTTPLSVVSDLTMYTGPSDLIGKVVQIGLSDKGGITYRIVRVDDVQYVAGQPQLKITNLHEAFTHSEQHSWWLAMHHYCPNTAGVFTPWFSGTYCEGSTEMCTFSGHLKPVGPLQLMTVADRNTTRKAMADYAKDQSDYEAIGYWRDNLAEVRKAQREYAMWSVSLTAVSAALFLGGCNVLLDKLKGYEEANGEARKDRVAKAISRAGSSVGPEAALIQESLLEQLAEMPPKGALRTNEQTKK